MERTRSVLIAVVTACSNPSVLDAPPPRPAATLPGAVEGDVVLADFHFTDGETLPALRIHYTTLGTHRGDNAVLIMHGTTGSGHQFFAPQFAGELFGPGQPLDAQRYFIILPDDIGHGRSSRPSDGLHGRFPHYGYHDMVVAEHALVQQLGVDHLRLVMGTSMGCMHSWMWAEQWPDMMDAVMPLACLPVQIAGRNRLWRKLAIDAVTADPHAGLRTAAAVFLIAGTNPLRAQHDLPTRDAADDFLPGYVDRFVATHDPDDLVYALASSGDYDPSRDLEKITAAVMFVNSADDFINPPELGIAEREIQRVPRGTFVLLPASAQTHGHGTHTWAAFWKDKLVELLAASQPR
ncbi:MAG: alpha/beta fold hydrolase [Acidobacteriota bacterium]